MYVYVCICIYIYIGERVWLVIMLYWRSRYVYVMYVYTCILSYVVCVSCYRLYYVLYIIKMNL